MKSVRGIYFKKTYCHFFQTNMLAFTRAQPGKAHPAPWVALPGSKGNDIEVEIVIEDDNLYKEYIEPYNLIWLIVSLVRVCFKPNINICILSKCGIESIKDTQEKNSVAVYETKDRKFKKDDIVINSIMLDWIKDNISAAVELYKNEQYKTLLQAYDYSQYNNLTSTSMISIWGALEQIFSSNAGELRYRVSISLAAYLENIGLERFRLYKKIQKLYDARSQAAHRNASVKSEDLLLSFNILSKVIIKITEVKAIPNQEDIEKMILAPEKNA